MSIGQLASTGKQDGATPSATKLYQVLVSHSTLGSGVYLSFYSTTKVESFDDLYTKCGTMNDYTIYCNVNPLTNSTNTCSSGYLKRATNTVMAGYVKDGTLVHVNLNTSNPGTYYNREM